MAPVSFECLFERLRSIPRSAQREAFGDKVAVTRRSKTKKRNPQKKTQSKGGRHPGINRSLRVQRESNGTDSASIAAIGGVFAFKSELCSIMQNYAKFQIK